MYNDFSFHKSSDHVVVIAEVGVNHNGNLDIAKQLILGASKAGADVVKFQYFEPSRLVRSDTLCAGYQQRLTSAKNQLDLLKPLALSLSSLNECKNMAESLGLIFMVTAFDERSVGELKQIDVNHFKIGSGDITDRLLLEALAKEAQTVLLSTGMSNLDEIIRALSWLKATERNTDVCKGILHCNSAYPSPSRDMNLRTIPKLEQRFGLPVGLSDHSLGLHMALAAIGLGARYIEKHITIDRNMEGPDHSSSMTIELFRDFISCIRSVELGLGSDEKFVTSSERENLNLARKGIYARNNILKGQVISKDDLAILRPQGQSDASQIYNFLGKGAKKSFGPGDEIF